MTRYEVAACPVCGEQDVTTLADRGQIEQQLEQLWGFHLHRLKPGAPVQQLFDRAIFSQQPPLNVVQCNRCQTVFRSPREREQELLETYQAEVPSQQALASLFEQQFRFFQPRVRKLGKLLGRAGSVLEIGSYVGGFLRAATDANWDARGIDVNRHASDFARSKGCSVTECAIEAYSPRRTYDVVALWNCFDQLADSKAVLGIVRTLLEPGGVIAIRVPNGAFFAKHVRRPHLLSRAVLAWNNMATFPYRYGFTPGSLRLLLENSGYRVLDVTADTLVPISSGWTRWWAVGEERLIKTLLKVPVRRGPLPWFEMYARRADQ